MNNITPTDAFGRPSILGNCNGSALPVRVLQDGSVSVSEKKHTLCASLRLDLSAERVKERHDIAFDSFAVSSISGSFDLFIGSVDDSKRCSIDKCLSADVSANSIFISNEPQSGFAELWFFKLQEVF